MMAACVSTDEPSAPTDEPAAELTEVSSELAVPEAINPPPATWCSNVQGTRCTTRGAVRRCFMPDESPSYSCVCTGISWSCMF